MYDNYNGQHKNVSLLYLILCVLNKIQGICIYIRFAVKNTSHLAVYVCKNFWMKYLTVSNFGKFILSYVTIK